LSKAAVAEDFKKVVEDARWGRPQSYAMAMAKLAADYKAENLKIYDMDGTSSLCDYNVIVSCQNSVQSRSLVDEIGRQLRAAGIPLLSTEGYDSADWILLDQGDVILHVFTETARDLYNLDHNYRLRKTVAIPEEFYFGAQTPSAEPRPDQLKGYF
jgi:ribosome-associated protein